MTASPIRKIAQLRDEIADAWYDRYEAPGVIGAPIVVDVPREEREPRAVMKHLLKAGIALSAAHEHPQNLTSVIESEAPVIVRVARTGWREGSEIFVTHGHVSNAAPGQMLMPPPDNKQKLTVHLEHVGSLEGWKSAVDVARHSTAMIVCLCATFAAPLLALAQRPNFAVVLVGTSRSGKSTAQLVGASALGFGAEEHLPHLNATEAGLLAAGMAFNDHVLPINEVGTASGAKHDAYPALRRTTYPLLSGHDVIRHTSWSAEGAGVVTTFHVIITLSSEHSPDVWAERGGVVRDEGERARLIGFPVPLSDQRTIFDMPPDFDVGQTPETWAASQFEHLRRTLPLQRGVAFQRYVDYLTNNTLERSERAQQLISYFENRVIKKNMTPIDRDIVGKFAVLFAGGVLASESGVWHIATKEIRDAIVRACLASIESLPDQNGNLRLDLETLAQRLQAGSILSEAKLTPKTRALLRRADGYWNSKNAGREFVIRAISFEGWFASAARVRDVLTRLADEGLLQTGGGQPKGRGNEWAQGQPRWPDGKRVRSFVIYLPNGMHDLNC